MNKPESFMIRKIELRDNLQVYNVISTVLGHFKADAATSALGDPGIKHMYENYLEPRAVYYVAESGGIVYGGCGVRQLAGTSENTCELQRMFLLPEARGLGLGRRLLELCIKKAGEFGYEKIYLESTLMMEQAIKMYKAAGFKTLSSPKGGTGHYWCNVFMELELAKNDK